MEQFIKPANLNGEELINELNAAGVAIVKPPSLDGEGILWLEIKSDDKSKAKKVVAEHNGTTQAPDRSAEKAALLEKLGITSEEAALLLS
jgi:hypothetical protein